MFFEEGLGKIKFRAFPKRVGPRITLEQVNTTEWSGVVNFHCIQMGLVMSMRLIFGDD